MPKYQGLSQQYSSLDEKIFHLRDSYEVGGSSVVNIIIVRVPVLNGAELEVFCLLQCFIVPYNPCPPMTSYTFMAKFN